MELSEAETNAQLQDQMDKSGTNCEVELDLSRLRAEFQYLTTDYFTQGNRRWMEDQAGCRAVSSDHAG